MRTHSFISLLFVVPIVLAGCSSSDDTGSNVTTDSATGADTAMTVDTATPAEGGTDSGTPGDSAASDTMAGDSGDLCSKLPANNAPEITDSVDTTPFPGSSATGGTIETGTYEETAHIYYQPASTPTRKWKGTMAIDAASGTAIANVSRDGTVVQQTGSTFTTSGNKITINFTCPAAVAGTSASLTYTYASGKLTLFNAPDKTATIYQKK